MKNLTILLIIASLFSCKTEKPKPFSYWKINGIEYSSNIIDAATGKVVASMTCGTLKKRYDLRFFQPYFPTSGQWLIVKQNPTQNPTLVDMNFYLESEIYHISPSENKKLIASSQDKNAKYTLTPTWFVNYNNPNDSVQIEGVFFVPL